MKHQFSFKKWVIVDAVSENIFIFKSVGTQSKSMDYLPIVPSCVLFKLFPYILVY